MKNEKAPTPEINSKEFEELCKYSHLTDNAEYGYIRGNVIGFSGKNVNVAPGAIINAFDFNKIGKNVRIGLYVYINGNVTIEDNVMIGPHCSIAASNHKFEAETGWFSGRSEDEKNVIVIGEGSWLASNVTVTAGVKIGKANLICAGAVVTKNTEDYAIMAGVPAKKIGHINPENGEYIWG